MTALCFRMILLSISFLGLNMLVIEMLQIENSYCAPLITSSLIIDVLMLAGLVGILEMGWMTIYGLGLIGFLWCIVIQRKRFSMGVIVILVIFVVYSIMHYYETYFTSNDSLSHWAKVSKYLQTYNRIPDSSTTLIQFVSYPVGSGMWIYYICHSIGCSPSGDLGAQMLLNVIALLPLFGLVRMNRFSGYIICCVSMYVLLAFDRFNYSIQVDWLIGYMTLGSTAILVAEHKNNNKAVARILPIVISIVLIKTSGVFFGLVVAGTYFLILQEDENRASWGVVWLIAGIALTFLVWQLRVRAAYRGYDLGKHVVSLQNYKNRMQGKDVRYLVLIAKNMLKQIFKPNIHMCFIPLYAMGLYIVLSNSRIKEKWLKTYKTMVIFSTALLILWYIMLGLVYFFSMSAQEAEALASFTRYQATVGIILFGYGVIFLLCLLSDKTIYISSGLAWKVSGALILFCLAYSIVSFGGKTAITILFDKSLNGMEENGCVYEIKRKNGLKEGKKIFAFAIKNDKSLQMVNALQYEFFSNDINILFRNPKNKEYQYELFDAGTFVNRPIYDLYDIVTGMVDNTDYILIVDKDAYFERVLMQAIKSTKAEAKVYIGYSM